MSKSKRGVDRRKKIHQQLFASNQRQENNAGTVEAVLVLTRRGGKNRTGDYLLKVGRKQRTCSWPSASRRSTRTSKYCPRKGQNESSKDSIFSISGVEASPPRPFAAERFDDDIMWSVELSCPGLLLPVESGCLISETPTVDDCWSCAGPVPVLDLSLSFVSLVLNGNASH